MEVRLVFEGVADVAAFMRRARRECDLRNGSEDLSFRGTLSAPAPRLRTQGGSAMLIPDLFASFVIGVVFLNALGEYLTFGILGAGIMDRASALGC